jgi:hypothetical protein
MGWVFKCTPWTFYSRPREWRSTHFGGGCMDHIRFTPLSIMTQYSLWRGLDGPHALYPRPLEWPGTHSGGGWMGPMAGLDGCGKYRLYRNSIP